MGKFSLGSFFGVTGTTAVLFKPKALDELLDCRLSAYGNECLYGFIKELDYLALFFEQCNRTPDWDKVVATFEDLGLLGIEPEMREVAKKAKVMKFYKDHSELSSEDLAKQSQEVAMCMSLIDESMTVDIDSKCKGLSRDAKVIVKELYSNYNYLKDLAKRCRVIYDNSHITEKKISGRPIREIHNLDMDSNDSNNSIRFVRNLYNDILTKTTKISLIDALEITLANIDTIINEYSEKEIVFTQVSELKEIVTKLADEITLDSLNEILGKDVDADRKEDKPITFEKANELFEELDFAMIGGLNLNTADLADSTLNNLKFGKSLEGYQTKQKVINEKLNGILAIAKKDAMSKRFILDKI